MHASSPSSLEQAPLFPPKSTHFITALLPITSTNLSRETYSTLSPEHPQVVSGLPEACAARTVSAHPQRKAQVAAALALDATIVPLLRPTVAGNRALEGAAGAVAVAGAVSMPGHMGLGVGPLRLAPAATVTAAVKLQQSALRRAGLKLLYAWAEQLGVAPRGLEHETEVGMVDGANGVSGPILEGWRTQHPLEGWRTQHP